MSKRKSEAERDREAGIENLVEFGMRAKAIAKASETVGVDSPAFLEYVKGFTGARRAEAFDSGIWVSHGEGGISTRWLTSSELIDLAIYIRLRQER